SCDLFINDVLIVDDGPTSSEGMDSFDVAGEYFFHLECSGPGGSISSRARLVVVNPTPVLRISVNPTQVQVNEPFTLSWASANTTSCDLFLNDVLIVDDGPTSSESTDRFDVAGEYFFHLECSGPGGSISNRARLAVVNPPPTCSAGTVNVVATPLRVSESAGLAEVVLDRTGDACGALVLNVQTLAGTATEGIDYEPVATQLSWADREFGSRIVTIPLLDDALDETVERFGLVLTRVSGADTLLQSGAVVEILDDDRPARLRFERNRVARENAGVVRIAAVLDQPSGREVRARLRLAGGSAIRGSDYGYSDGTLLIFPPGVTRVEKQVVIFEDTLVEGDETLLLELVDSSVAPRSPIGARLGSRRQMTLTIRDND
ncbi:MAG TPA: Calx-beta domain-containing protein, partial [Nevskiaceae bacterium]|nr:Calx-beta domain-containing protein [Nevskiaceae bacterium]